MYVRPGQPTRFTTALEYERLPEGTPYELIGGQLVMSPAPILFHQRITKRLLQALSDFVETHELGEVIISPMDVYFTLIDVYQPDLLFIRKENVPKLDPNGWVKLVPDMVVEVLSPTTKQNDYARKKKIYGECGVSEYWIVDPSLKTAEILVNDGGEYKTEFLFKEGDNLTSSMFPGFSLPLPKLFLQ